MKNADNIKMLELVSERGAIYPTLIWDDRDVVLIDTGLPGQLEILQAEVEKAGFRLEQITKVIITHHDMDHIGCAKTLSGFGAEIIAHEQETPYLQGDETSPRIVAMEERFNELSEGERAFYERVKAGAHYFYVHVDKVVKDGDTFAFCGGIQVIHTPGHTPGHIALLLKESNVLVAGDAANITDGKLTGPDPQHTPDMRTAAESFKKIESLSATSIICYHGGVYERQGF